MIKPTLFQQHAIDKVVAKARAVLDAHEAEPHVVLLKAPTGSGKTVMAGIALRDLAADQERDLAFIWIAPLTLQHQSRRRIEGISGGVFTITDLTADQVAILGRNEMGFINWASVNRTGGTEEERKRASRLLEPNERGTDIASFCEKTRLAGRQIVLVIDESHHSAGTDAADEFIQRVRPALILEMTATPGSITRAAPDRVATVEVAPQDVRDAGLIKQKILVNDGLDGDGPQEDLETALLDAALARRAEIAEAFASASSNVRPLLLIQLPDGKRGDDALEWVTDKLKESGLTLDNERFAIWLSERRTVAPDAPELLDQDGWVEALAFKQAVATGWDCPRAHVLLKLRDPSKKDAFEVQTIGRIMRMPERRHYDDPLLDNGFVYTGHEKYKAAEGFTPPLDAPMAWRGEFDRPSLARRYLGSSKAIPLATDIVGPGITDALGRLGITSGMDVEAARTLLTESGLSLDRHVRAPVHGELTDEAGGLRQLDETGRRFFDREATVQRRFEGLLSAWLGPLESPGDAREEIYDVVMPALGMEQFSDVQNFFLVNEGTLSAVIEDAFGSKKGRTERSIDDSSWEPPAITFVNTRTATASAGDGGLAAAGLHEEVSAPHSAYAPCLLREDRSEPEKRFEEWLEGEGSSLIAWWMKNGEGSADYFSVTYDGPDGEANFFPDHVVGFTDGTLGIFETKGGEAFTAPTDRAINEAKLRSLVAWAADMDAVSDVGFVVLSKGLKLVREVADLDGGYLTVEMFGRHGG